MKTTWNFRAGAAESCNTRQAEQDLTPRCGPIGPLEAQRQFSAPPAPVPSPTPDEGGAIVFWYRNYNGDEGYRRVRPISIRFGASEWHKEPQWLMLAYDTVNDKTREFAMRDISGIVGSPVIECGISDPRRSR